MYQNSTSQLAIWIWFKNIQKAHRRSQLVIVLVWESAPFIGTFEPSPSECLTTVQVMQDGLSPKWWNSWKVSVPSKHRTFHLTKRVTPETFGHIRTAYLPVPQKGDVITKYSPQQLQRPGDESHLTIAVIEEDGMKPRRLVMLTMVMIIICLCWWWLLDVISMYDGLLVIMVLIIIV